MSAEFNNEKIYEALDLLNEAAREKKEELTSIIGQKYGYIKDIFSQGRGRANRMKSELRENYGEALEFGQEKIKEKASEVDEKIHENPWPYLGGVAVSCILLGYILGHDGNTRK